MSSATSQSPDDEMFSALHSNLSSHLRQRLRSYTISTTELQHISEVLARKENELAQDIRKHRMEVSRHQAILIELENKQKGLKMCSDACRSLSAPIRRLPLEMLKEIFTHFCDEIVISSSLTGLFHIPPLKLAAICGSWRDLALSTSSLWTRIEVDTSLCQSLDRLRRVELLANLVLEHSGNAPLHLRVRASLSIQQDAVTSIVKSIAQHSHHWCHVTLQLHDTLLNEMNPFIKALPLLESLTTRSYAVVPFDMVNIAPKLRHVNLQKIDEPTDLKLPWHQILTLKVKSIDVLASEVVACLRLCTSLQRLDLLCSGNSEEDSGGLHTIHKLESLFLEIKGPGLSVLAQLLTLLTLPQLTTLSISYLAYSWERDDTFVPIAENFFMRSSCTITSLTLLHTPFTDDELISLLRLLPSIEELSISQCSDITMDDSDPDSPLLHNITDLFIMSLQVSHSGSFNNAPCQPLLPNLLKIDLTMDCERAPSCQALIALVKSRWVPDPTYAADIGVVCLKTVVFWFLAVTEEPFDYDFYPLMCLRDVGLNLTTVGTGHEDICDESVAEHV